MNIIKDSNAEKELFERLINKEIDLIKEESNNSLKEYILFQLESKRAWEIMRKNNLISLTNYKLKSIY